MLRRIMTKKTIRLGVTISAIYEVILNTYFCRDWSIHIILILSAYNTVIICRF